MRTKLTKSELKTSINSMARNSERSGSRLGKLSDHWKAAITRMGRMTKPELMDLQYVVYRKVFEADYINR